MHDMNLEKYRSKIQTAYKASPFTKGIFPEPEDAVKRFESRYAPIPAEYRWLLLNFGGCYLAEPWIFTLKELEEAYPTFQSRLRGCNIRSRMGRSTAASRSV